MDILFDILGQEYAIFYNNEPSLQQLKGTVMELCKEEAMVRGFCGKVPILKIYNDKFKKWSQLHSNSKLEDGQTVQVSFETPLLPVPAAAMIQMPDPPKEVANTPSASSSDFVINGKGSNTPSQSISEFVVTGEGMVRVVPMSSDGQCLMYALIHQLNPEIYENPEKFKIEANELRQAVVKHIRKYMKDFKLTLLDSIRISMLQYNQRTPKGQIDSFMKNLENGKEWGGYETLVACSKLKSVQIKVLQEVWKDDNISAKSIIIESDSGKEITIVYRLTQDPEALQTENPGRNHYDSFLEFTIDKHHDVGVTSNKPEKIRGEKSDQDSTNFDEFDSDEEEEGEPNRLSQEIELTTDEEMMEYYGPGEWEILSENHKRSEKRRWVLQLQKEMSGDLTPFQANLISPISDKLKRKRKCISSSSSSKESSPGKTPLTERNGTGNGKKTTINSSDERDNNSSDEMEKENKTPSKGKRKYRPRLKIKRDINMKVTNSNCLPDFSAEALLSLQEDDPDFRKILPDIRCFLRTLIGKDYPTRDEYNLLGSNLIAKYPCLADVDNPRGFASIKLKIRKGLSQNTLQRRNKEDKLAKIIEQRPSVVIRDRSAGPSEAEMDQQLRETGGEVNETNKLLISRTYQYRHRLFSEEKKEVAEVIELWLLYPHLMTYEMLSYEYTLVLHLTLVDLKANIDKTMENLKKYYKPTGDINKITEISILERVYNEITPLKYRKIGMVPALDIKDEDVVRDGFCQDQAEKNSPRVLVISRYSLEGKDIPIYSYLLSSGRVLSKCANPGVLEVVVQLLAPYFLMDLSYPDSYKSFLRFLEKIANGGLCLQTTKQRPHETYQKFIRAVGLQERL